MASSEWRYEPPSVVALGTVRELTLQAAGKGAAPLDGAGFQPPGKVAAGPDAQGFQGNVSP
jgi:hypothetical protein